MIRRGTKFHNVLAALARGQAFNRFQAERELHDHVLPSTIQKIQRLGITVSRQHETVPVWLEADERAKAVALLESQV